MLICAAAALVWDVPLHFTVVQPALTDTAGMPGWQASPAHQAKDPYVHPLQTTRLASSSAIVAWHHFAAQSKVRNDTPSISALNSAAQAVNKPFKGETGP